VTPCILHTKDGSDEVRLESPYNGWFVERFKQAVPHLDRQAHYEQHSVVGDSKTFKHWTFNRSWFDRVVEVCLECWELVMHHHTLPSGEVRQVNLRTGEVITQGDLFATPNQ